MAAKLKGNFLVLLRVAFNINITSHLTGVKKNSVNFFSCLSFRGGMEFQELVRAHLDTCLRLSSLNEAVSRRCKLRKTGEKITLLEVLFVNELLRVN